MAIFLVTLLVSYVAYEPMVRLLLWIRPNRRFALMSAFQRAGARRALVLAHTYCGFRLIVSAFPGRLPSQCLVVSNHQSLADIPVLMHSLPALDLRFVAKRELRRGIPSVSLTLRTAGHALIGRHSGFAGARRELQALARLAEKGISPVVFPEGTRSRTGEVQTFHAAAVRVLAAATDLPILSVAVEGGSRISRLKGLARNLIGATYRVAPLTLYPPARTRPELVAVLSAARTEISARVRLWREHEEKAQPHASGAAPGSRGA